MTSLVTPDAFAAAAPTATGTPVAVADALDEAEGLVCDYLRRPTLAVHTYTETIRPVNGRVFPTWQPVVSVEGDDWERENDALIRAVGGWSWSDLAEVTYGAGWTLDTLPRRIRRQIVLVTAALLAEQCPDPVLADIPARAKSVSSGDQAITLESIDPALDELDRLAPGTTRVLRPWRSGR